MAVIRLNRATEQACVPCGPRHYLNVFIYFSTFVPSVGYTAVSLKSPCQIEGVTPASVICHQCPITTNHKTVNCKNRCLFWSRFHNSMLSLASRCVHLFATPWTAAHQASLSITNFLELAPTHVHQVSNAIQPSHPLSSPSPSAFSLSQYQGLFQ